MDTEVKETLNDIQDMAGRLRDGFRLDRESFTEISHIYEKVLIERDS
jgi:hypothetical protein